MESSNQTNSAPASEHIHQASLNTTEQKIAQRDYEKAQAEVDKWEKYHQLAQKAGNQDLIRAAQFQQARSKAIAEKLKALISKTTQINTTQHTLEDSQLHNQLYKDNSIKNTNNTYAQIETRILQLQTYIEAISQQNQTSAENKLIINNLNQELIKLKTELQTLATQKQTLNSTEQIFDAEIIE